MRREAYVAAGLALLLALAGCSSVLGGDVPPDRVLYEPTEYDWNTTADVTITVTSDARHRVVYDLEDRSTLELFRNDGLGNKQPLQIRGLAYRYENGTLAENSSIEVEATRHLTVITLPGDDGTVAYTADGTRKRFRMPTFHNGSHEVVLPPDRRVGNPVFGRVHPGADDRTVASDGRLHISWSEMPADRMVVQYYLARDVPIFGGIVLVGGLFTLGGVAYYYRQMQQLRAEREAAGLDVDLDDDDRRRPPPGMG